MEKFGFFSSIDGDRLYTAKDFTSYFGMLLTNGIFDVNNAALKVTANGTLEITVNPGVMWINGHVYELTEPKTLVVDTEGNMSRRDRVIVKLDYVNREIRTEIKKGVASNNPVYPEVTRDEDSYEMVIAQYEITKGATTIQQSSIVDTRKDIELCGEVTSLLEKRTLLDFCQVHGFTMEGVINSKDIMPLEDANIGSIDNPYKKIFTKDIEIINGIPYLPLKGGELEGTVKVQDIIPALANMYRLGTEEKPFISANINSASINNFNGNPTFDGDGDLTINNPVLKTKEVNATSLKVNNHQVFIQSDAPANAKAGDVWIQV